MRYLRAVQNADGGFGQTEGRSSNAQSTAWAVQGLVAAGVRPEGVGANPMRYLAGLRRRDGHIAYSRTSDQTPVWVTGQALLALRKATFPLGAVPRARRGGRAGSGAGAAAAAPSGVRAERKREPKAAPEEGRERGGRPRLLVARAPPGRSQRRGAARGGRPAGRRRSAQRRGR